MQKGTIKDCRTLLGEYEQRRAEKRGLQCDLLHFEVPKEQFLSTDITSEITVYNPTRPIRRHGKSYIFGRVEPKNSERSKVAIFESHEGKWRVANNRPTFDLQDPFFASKVQGYYVFGGVEIKDDAGILRYRTVFYRWKDCIEELWQDGKSIEPFARGPWGMKDIRLIEIGPGRIALFTRPQGEIGGRGKIAYVEISSLDELGEAVPLATIIPNQFHDDEWGGVNELHLLKNGKIGVLGHIAHIERIPHPSLLPFQREKECRNLPRPFGERVGVRGEIAVRHYYAMAFCFDPETRQASEMDILTTAGDFPYVESKKPELGKIIFSGGLERLPTGGMASLYVGIGDVTAGCAHIKDPFIKWEN